MSLESVRKSENASGAGAESDETLCERIRVLDEELVLAQQTTALGELLGTTTHEFNNVLTTILNYAKLGLRHTDEPTRTKALEKIFAAGQRAERITNSVLGLARNRGTEALPTDMAALVEESLVLLERELQKYRVGVETSFETRKPAKAVGNQIQQVLLNLLTNARQAMPQGGQVMIRIAENAPAKKIELTVRDNGEGIPAESLPRIFDRHFSTKTGPDASGKGGSGFGLNACRQIIERHGGEIRVESEVGKGTTFIVSLPIATAEPIASQPIVPLGVPSDGPTAASA